MFNLHNQLLFLSDQMLLLRADFHNPGNFLRELALFLLQILQTKFKKSVKCELGEDEVQWYNGNKVHGESAGSAHTSDRKTALKTGSTNKQIWFQPQ